MNYESLREIEEKLNEKREELSSLTEGCNKRKEEKSRILGEIGSLKEQKATLQGALAQMEKQSMEIITGLNQKVALTAQRAGAKATQDIGVLVARLTTEVANKLDQERSFKGHLDALESSIEGYVQLKALADLVLERAAISSEDVRFLSLTLLSKVVKQLNRRAGNDPDIKWRIFEIERWIEALEKWRPR